MTEYSGKGFFVSRDTSKRKQEGQEPQEGVKRPKIEPSPVKLPRVRVIEGITLRQGTVADIIAAFPHLQYDIKLFMVSGAGPYAPFAMFLLDVEVDRIGFSYETPQLVNHDFDKAYIKVTAHQIYAFMQSLNSGRKPTPNGPGPSEWWKVVHPFFIREPYVDNGQVKNFLVAARSLVGITQDIKSIVYVGSKASARSGIWHPYFLKLLEIIGFEGRVMFFDPHEVPSALKMKKIEVIWHCGEYKGTGSKVDLVIDDAYDERSVQQHYSQARYASYKVPLAQRGDETYLGKKITIDPLNKEGRAFPKHCIESENHYPGGDRCAVCRYINSIADGLESIEAYAHIRSSVTKLGLTPCSAYHGAQDLLCYAYLYKQLIRRGEVPLQDIFTGTDENMLQRVLPMLTQDGVAVWNGTGFTLSLNGGPSKIFVQLPHIYGEQETLASWTRQYGGMKWRGEKLNDNVGPPVSWIKTMESATLNITYCPPSMIGPVMYAVLNSTQTPITKLELGLKVLEVSRNADSPLHKFILDKEVYHRGVAPADYPCSPRGKAEKVYLTVESGRPNYNPEYIITLGKLRYPDYLQRSLLMDSVGQQWNVYAHYNMEEGVRYKIMVYVEKEAQFYVFMEGAKTYVTIKKIPPARPFWSKMCMRAYLLESREEFILWVGEWGERVSSFQALPPEIYAVFISEKPDYYELGEDPGIEVKS